MDGLKFAMEHYTLLNCTILLVFGQPQEPIFTFDISYSYLFISSKLGLLTIYIQSDIHLCYNKRFNLEEHHAHSWLVYTSKRELVY